MEINDLERLVAQNFAQYNGQLRSHMIQQTLDDIGTLYNVDPYNQNLCFQVVDEISLQAKQAEDFRFCLSFFQPDPTGINFFNPVLETESNQDMDNQFARMLGSINSLISKLDLAYYWYSIGRIAQSAKLLQEIINQDGCANNPEAAFNLGELYLFAQGVIQNMRKGFELILCAAQNSYKAAYFDTGFCYYSGWGNNPQAEFWLNESLYKSNNPQAAIVLGGMFQENAITNFELDSIISILAWAINTLTANKYNMSDLWFGQGYYVLATIMSQFKSDEETAYYHLTQSANLDNVGGQNALGYAFYHGLGCISDKSKAKYWWNEAAQKKCPEACYHLGLMYLHDNLVDHNLAEVRKLMEIAAKSGRIPDADAILQTL